MKTGSKARRALAGIAVLLVLGACGAGSSGDPAREGSKTSSTADISEGVQPDEAAVRLLPQSYKDRGN